MSCDFEDCIPPQSLEMEQATLGAMLIDQDAIALAADILRASDFYRIEHGAIFEAILAVSARGYAVDLVTVQDYRRAAGELELVGGSPYLVHSTDTVPSSVNVEFYARVVQEKATLRRILGASSRSWARSLTGSMTELPTCATKRIAS